MLKSCSNIDINKISDFVLINNDCYVVLQSINDDCIDCVITSPPYWKMRNYNNTDTLAEIGNEDSLSDYVLRLTTIFNEIKRVLKPTGSLWLNLGDKYNEKSLQGIPWRVAISLCDSGWILRNDVIWNQMKGTQSCKDRLRDSYEHFFHFVKSKKYYYDSDRIKIKPKTYPKIVDDKIISATGVSGKKYRKIISESTHLTDNERLSAMNALESVIEEMRTGKINDFRMTIRGTQRAWHSEDTSISGRANELRKHGFYIMKIHSSGHLPSDIWNIVPEDTWRKDNHCAVFPEELLRIPLLATCPTEGIVLDPFSGTGTTIAAALKLGRRGIGIELNDNFIKLASQRINEIVDNRRNSLLSLCSHCPITGKPNKIMDDI